MARPCTVCTHAEREAIEAQLIAGRPLRSVAQQFGLSATALHRHKGRCVGAAIVKAGEAANVAHGDNLLEQVRAHQARAERLYAEAEAILRRAKRDRDHDTALEAIRTAAAAVREGRGILELLTKVYLASAEVITRDQAQALLGAVLDVIRRHVRDRDTLRAISEDLRRVGGSHALGEIA
ncbi:MAG: hypothetical protein ACOY3Y_03890 [Acidobacteriota bacterium]